MSGLFPAERGPSIVHHSIDCSLLCNGKPAGDGHRQYIVSIFQQGLKMLMQFTGRDLAGGQLHPLVIV